MAVKVAYIHNDSGDKAITGIAIKIALASFALIAVVTQALQAHFNQSTWIPTISASIVATIFGAIVFCHNRWLWRFGKPKIIDISPWPFLTKAAPDLTGEWTLLGVTKCHNNPSVIGQEWGGKINIEQSGDCISVILETDKSRSHAIGAASITSSGKETKLRYMYENSPDSNGENLSRHIGACEIHFDLKSGTAKGNYFSDHSRRSAGTFTLTKKI